MSSILTNNGAMVALQTLRGINSALDTTQNEISTGKTINTAKDNAALWTISKVMESDIAGFKQVSNSLSLATGAVTNARSAAETVGQLIEQIKDKVVSAQDGNQDRATLQKDVDALVKQINLAVEASQFNGINLVNGEYAAENDDKFNALASLDRGGDAASPLQASFIEVDLTKTNLSTAAGDASATPAVPAGGLAKLAEIDLTEDLDAAGFQALLDDVEAAMTTALDAASEFGTAGKRIEIQAEFISKLSDSMTTAVGAVIDTNMEEASARLKALQTQQQLGVQALSIANAAPQNILALFR